MKTISKMSYFRETVLNLSKRRPTWISNVIEILYAQPRRLHFPACFIFKFIRNQQGTKELLTLVRRLQKCQSEKQAFTERRRTSASKQIGKVRFGYNRKASQGFMRLVLFGPAETLLHTVFIPGCSLSSRFEVLLVLRTEWKGEHGTSCWPSKFPLHSEACCQDSYS